MEQIKFDGVDDIINQRALPSWFEIAYSSNGRMYFIDHRNNTTSWVKKLICT